MNTVRRFRARFRRRVLNRWYIAFALLWLALFLPLLWEPYPHAERVSGPGFETPRECLAVIYDHAGCVLHADGKAAMEAYLWRAGFILLPGWAPAALSPALALAEWNVRRRAENRG